MLKISLALLLFVAPSFAADATEFKAGGVLLTLPGPTADFPEVGDQLRTTFFELLAPANNRLLSAYVPTQTLEKFRSGKKPGMDWYGVVEVSRRAEYAECTPATFAQTLKSVEPALGKFSAKDLSSIEDEMNSRLKTLDVSHIDMSHPEMLGGIFQKADSAAFAMLMTMKQGETTDTMACAMAMLRVKQRLVFAYLYRRYESPDTIAKLRREIETWSDSILAANK